MLRYLNFVLIVTIITSAFHTIGCGTTGKQPSETERRFLQLESGIAKTIDAINQLKDVHGVELENIKKRLLNIEADIIYLKAKLTQPLVPTSPLPSPEDAKKVENIVQALKTGTIFPDSAATELVKISETATPILIKSLKDAKRTKDFDLVYKLEPVLGKMAVPDLKAHIPPLLKEPILTRSVVSIIGNSGNFELSSYLEDLTNEQDKEFRFALGEALIKCKNKKGIPLLIETLRFEEGGYNILAYDILSKATKNTFDYKIYAPIRENEPAIKKWEDWWKEEGEKFEFPK